MDDISVSNSMVLKLIANRKIDKAAGPDLIGQLCSKHHNSIPNIVILWYNYSL
jgi:hypothetical protein